MQIVKTNLYLSQLMKILKYISIDKINAAREFKMELSKQIKDIVNFPYKYRKSYYYEDENIRDMIFKGYTIIYKINKDLIEILEVFNKNVPVLNDIEQLKED